MLGDVQPRQDLDPRDERAGGCRARRGKRSQDPVDADADQDVAPARLEMDVACPKTDGLIEDVVERPNHGRAAREVAQAVGIVGTRFARFLRRARLGVARTPTRIERDLDVLAARDLDRDLAAERQGHGVDGIEIRRIGDRKMKRAVRRAVRIETPLVQERQREVRREGVARAQQIQWNAREGFARRRAVDHVLHERPLVHGVRSSIVLDRFDPLI